MFRLTRSPLRFFFALAVLVALLAALAVALPAHAEVDRTRYRGTTPGVEIVFPTDWIVAEQASFPTLLSTATDVRYGGRMTLTIERLRDGENLRACVDRNRALLAKLGFATQPVGQHTSGALLMQMVTRDGKKVVRQAYRKFDSDETLVFVLTLAAPRDTMQRYVRVFDDTVRSLARLPDAKAPVAAAPAARDEAGVDVPAPPAEKP